MQDYSILLLRFLSELQTSQSVDASFDIFQRYILQLGYDGVNYAFAPIIEYDNPVFNQPVFKLSEIFAQDFMEHYQKGGLAEHDYTVKAVMSGQQNTMNWWQDAQYAHLTMPEKNVLDVAKDYGIYNGLTVPLMKNAQGMAGASIVSHEKNEAFAKLNAEAQAQATLYIQLFHNHVWGGCSIELFRQYNETMLAHLSVTERRLLRLLISGKPMKCICDELGISTRYGEKLSTQLRRKFGGISRNRLLYYAGLLNIGDTL